MADVFVSYARQDGASIESIVRRLAGRGFGVWWDRSLVAGDDFGAAIERALAASKCAVVAWSRLGQHSLWVKAEANAAWESGKLVQLTLDGTKPPLPFSTLHTLSFSQDDGSPEATSMRELIAAVESRITGAPIRVEAPGHELKPDLVGFGP